MLWETMENSQVVTGRTVGLPRLPVPPLHTGTERDDGHIHHGDTQWPEHGAREPTGCSPSFPPLLPPSMSLVTPKICSSALLVG